MIGAMRLDLLLQDERLRQGRVKTELILIAIGLLPVVDLEDGQG